MNMLGPTNYHENLSVWENPPCTPDLIPKNPEYSYSDLRAIAEKRRRYVCSFHIDLVVLKLCLAY